jgi:xanthine dehydrogenase accessory factor
MKELRDIVQAFDQATKEGKQTALATVVHVQGSSYRRPGARMLIREDGQLTGAISGGCLEGDALRKAQLVMVQQHPLLVLYDTTDEDDAKVGIGLGCNGIIHILIEPISALDTNNPIQLLRQFVTQRQNAVLVTLFSLEDRRSYQPGTRLLVTRNKVFNTLSNFPQLSTELIDDGFHVLEHEVSAFKSYKGEGFYTAFIEFLKPPIALVIVGAGNDAIPLSKMAAILGWHITVVDGRANYVTSERFSDAHDLVVCKPEKVLDRITTDEQTAFVLMTHNYNYDLRLLSMLLPLDIAYVGSLGPKKKMERMLDELHNEGLTFNEQQLEKVYGPTGLDLGAEGAEEIALSIISEIQKILTKTKGTSLREKHTGIHSDKKFIDL